MTRRKHRDWGQGWIEVRQRVSGVRYVARWMERGRQRARTFPSERAAQDFLYQRHRDVQQDRPDPGTMADAAQRYLDRGMRRWSPRSQALYPSVVETHILPVLGAIPLDQLTHTVMQRVIDDLSTTLAPSTVRLVVGVIRAILREAEHDGLVHHQPLARVRVPPKDTARGQAWTPDEVRRVLAAVQDDPWWTAFYLVALTTGMRPGELRGLLWGDIDPVSGTITVQRTAITDAQGRIGLASTTKGKQARVVALAAVAWDALARLGPGRPDALIFGAHGQPRHGRVILARHYTWCTNAGVPVIRLHDLRGTAATLMIEQGMNPKVVADILGHATAAFTLDVYARSTAAMRAQAAAAVAGVLQTPHHTSPPGGAGGED